MSKIPFPFDAIPKNLRKSGLLKINNRNALVFFIWCCTQVSADPQTVIYDGKKVELEPYEFIFTISMCVDETDLTFRQVVTQRDQLVLGKKLVQKPSGKTSGKTSGRFSIYKLCTESFSENSVKQNVKQNVNETSIDRQADGVSHTVHKTKELKEQQPLPLQRDVVVFSCLEKFIDSQVPMDEKISLCQKYSEEIVANAVSVVSDPKFVPESSVLRSLKAACKGKWKNNETEKKNAFDKNKTACINYFKTDESKPAINWKGKYMVSVSPDYVEISYGSNVKHIEFSLESAEFSSQVNQAIR